LFLKYPRNSEIPDYDRSKRSARLNFRSAGVVRPFGFWVNNLSTIQPKMISPGVQAGIKQRKGEPRRKKSKKIHFPWKM
jgi:hypothetical protein